MEGLGQVLGDLMRHQHSNDAILPPVVAPPICRDCFDAETVCVSHPDVRGEAFLYHMTGGTNPGCRYAPCHCVRERLAAEHAAHLRAWCELPEKLQSKTFAALKPRKKPDWCEALEFCREYAAGQRAHKWIRLWGPPGTGKTHLGAAIVNDRLSRGRFAKYVYVADWLASLKATFERARRQEEGAVSEASYEDVWASYADAPLLLLDDLGAQQHTAWSDGELDRLIDHRYRLELETIITTNAETPEALGSRIADRLQDRGLVKGLKLTGPSYRPLKEPT